MRTLLLAVLTSIALCGTASAAGLNLLELELRLPGALRPADAAADAGPHLVLDLARDGDRWERVWGVQSDSRKAMLYHGRVRKAEVSDVRIAIEIAIQDKNLSRVQVELKRSADGKLAGNYKCTTPSGENQGAVEGQIKPQRPALPAGFVVPKPGEHPRILFRTADLPALKEKAKTPLGRAFLARMGSEKGVDAIGAAIRWQLTRDPQFADLARRLAERQIEGKGLSYSGRESKGRVPEQIALSYDLCYDVWPADFKAQVEEHLLKTVKTYMGKMSGNEHVCSNWNSRVHAGAGFAMLALWGEKGPMPEKPAGAKSADTLKFWEDDVADWKRLGEVNFEYQWLFERTRYLLYLFCREATGTGGFRGENAHYGMLAAEMSLEYAACYRKMFGMDVSPYNDLTWMVPRMIFGHDYPEGGKPVPLNINGYTAISNGKFAYGYTVVPDQWRRAYLWAWNRQLGVNGPDELVKAAEAGTVADAEGVSSWFFLNYPLDVKPRPPAETMPLVWQAPDHGYYGFRSGWTGRGDCILQVHAKTHFTGGWNSPDAGTFHLYGRGYSWNETSSHRDANVWEEDRVMLPDDKVNVMGLGRMTFVEQKPDGSGSLTIDLSDAYNGADSGRFYTMYGNFRNASLFKDQGVRATRAMAVDYSGRCGAPCLFVVVDRIRGGGRKVWTWNLGDTALVPKVAIAGNSFTIPRSAASLRGTFVTPSGVAIKATVHEAELGGKGEGTTRKIPSIFAEGGDDFFFIATVQDEGKPAPEVKAEGSGLDAKVTIGGRRVSFDGQKIVIADK